MPEQRVSTRCDAQPEDGRQNRHMGIWPRRRALKGMLAVPIFPGAPTPVLRYAGEVLRGRSDGRRPGSGYLGPTLDICAAASA